MSKFWAGLICPSWSTLELMCVTPVTHYTWNCQESLFLWDLWGMGCWSLARTFSSAITNSLWRSRWGDLSWLTIQGALPVCLLTNTPIPVGQVITIWWIILGRRLSGISFAFRKWSLKTHILPWFQNGSFNHLLISQELSRVDLHFLLWPTVIT